MHSGASRKQRPKLLVLQTHPIQYYAPIYRALAERGQIQVKVLYLTDAGAKAHHDPGFGQQVTWDIPLLDGYDYRIMKPGIGITDLGFWGRDDSNLTRILDEERPDWILLYGYASRMNWRALAWARKNNVCVAYTSDSNSRDIEPGWKTNFKRVVLKGFFNRVNCFLSPSDANRDYLLHFGATAERIRFMPFAIDVERFASARDSTAKTKFPKYHFIWAGKMIERKRPQDFIRALELLHSRGVSRVRACMVGNGLMISSLRPSAEDVLPVGLLDWLGFVNQSEMPETLCNASALVFTSEKEPYGLIATEAAACGLALIAAENIGCVGPHSSAQPAVNALTYRPGDVQGLADCMESLLTDPARLKAMQSASAAIAADHDISRAAAIIESVIINEHKDHA